MSYLDLPELAAVGILSKRLRRFATDLTLHRIRLLVVTPCRLEYFLSERGTLLRPSIAELAQRGIMRGLFVERRWRAGSYLYSAQVGTLEELLRADCMECQSVRQYENSKQVARAHVCHVLERLLRRVKDWGKEEKVSPVLLPVVHRLKWSIQRDNVSRQMRSKHRRPPGERGRSSST